MGTRKRGIDSVPTGLVSSKHGWSGKRIELVCPPEGDRVALEVLGWHGVVPITFDLAGEVAEMKRRFSIPYGDVQQRLEVDDGRLSFFVQPPDPLRPTLKEEQDTVLSALQEPTAAPRLQELIEPRHRIAILSDDFTRPTPTHKILPVVLAELARIGVPDQNIRIVVARGMHRRLTRSDMEAKVGRDILDRFDVKNHENDRNLVQLGRSRKGTPVWVNATVVEADVRIAIGNICAHPVAGFGGGAKIIVPGVAGAETIHVNHSLCDHPNVTIGATDGNPVREDMEEIARTARLDFLINTILNPQKEIVAAFAGDVVAAHRAGVRHYTGMYGARVQEPADVVVVGASPRDATFGHATFALYAAVTLARPGSVLILVAPCTEGPGTKEAREGFRALARKPLPELMRLIRTGQVSASGGAFNYAYSKAMNRSRVVLVSDRYTSAEAADLGVGYASSVQEALDSALSEAGAAALVGVMPAAGLAVPITT
jgi:nickel-dependent lactate racemase